MSTSTVPLKRKHVATIKPWWQRSVPTICAVLGVVASLTALYLFFTLSVSVNPSDPLNQEALSAPFAISNTSQFLSLYKIQTSCNIIGEMYAGHVSVGHDRTAHYSAVIPELGPGGYDTIYCNPMPFKFQGEGEGKTINADVAIGVQFTSFFYTRETYFRFVTRTDSEGKVHWVHYGLKDEDPNFKENP